MTEDSKIVDDDDSKSILALDKTHSEELLKYESMINEMDFKMLQHVIDYSKLGIKGLFVLNGTAAVSILTIFSNALVKDLSLSSEILNSAIIFSIGALCSIICIILAYFSQTFYKNYSVNRGKVALLNLAIKQKGIVYFFFNENCRRRNNDLDLESFSEGTKEIHNTIKSGIDDTEKEKKDFEKLANKNLKTGDRIRNVCVGFSILSIVLFICGVVNIKNSFSTPEEPTPQITITNSSYPNVEITPIPNKH